jgi:hypothetical protein
VLQIGTHFQAVIRVVALGRDWVAVQCQFSELGRIFERLDVFYFLDFIIAKEDSLKPGAVLQSLDRFDLVTPKIKLSERNKSVQVLY